MADILQGIFAGTTAPDNTTFTTNIIWRDTSVTPNVLKIYSGGVWSQISASAVMVASDGLTVNGSNAVVLGQTVGQSGNPGKLLENREVPLNGFSLQFTGSLGNFVIGNDGVTYTFGPAQFTTRNTNLIFSYNLPNFANFTGNGNIGFALDQGLQSLTTGYQNIAIGDFSSTAITTGYQNTAVGPGSNQRVTTGNHNSAYGVQALQWPTTTSFNNAFGNLSSGTQMGNNNILFGASNNGGLFAVTETIGNNNILIGFETQRTHNTTDNNIVIGNNSYTSATSNTTILGSSINTALSNIVVIGSGSQNVIMGSSNPTVDNGARLQVAKASTGITTAGPTSVAASFNNSGSTANTTSNAVTVAGVQITGATTLATGANALTNIGLIATATGATGVSFNYGIVAQANGSLGVNYGLVVQNSSFTGQGFFYQSANNATTVGGGPATENVTFGPSNRIFLNASEVKIQSQLGTQAASFQLNSGQLAGSAGDSLSITIPSTVASVGTQNFIRLNGTVAQQSGSPTFINFNINPTYNYTTTTAPTVRGVYYNPVVTSLAGTVTHIAWENTVGNAIFGSTSGNVLIGGSSDNGNKLQVFGQGYFSTTVKLDAIPTTSVANAKPVYWDNVTHQLATITGAGIINGANNGLTVTSDIVQLGQAVGAVGDPGKLLANTEIPMNAFNLTFKGSTGNNIQLFDNGDLKSRTLTISGETASPDGSNVGIGLYSRTATVASGNYSEGIQEFSFVNANAGFFGYIGVESWAYVIGATGGSHGKFTNYITAFSAGQVWDGSLGGGSHQLGNHISYFSAIQTQSGGVLNAYDHYVSEINTVGGTTANPAVTNHYAFYAEPFTYATNNWGIYINGVQRNYFGGFVGIGQNNPQYPIDINQTVSGSSDASAINVSTTWNTTGNVSAFFMEVFNTASGAGSRLVTLAVSNVVITTIDLAGNMGTNTYIGGGLQSYGGGQGWAFVASRNLTAATGDARGFADQTLFTGSNGIAYAAFDAAPQLFNASAVTYDHLIAFQARGVFDSTGGSITNLYGFGSYMNSKHGTCTNYYDFYAEIMNFGSGVSPTVTNRYNFYASGDTRATNNWGVYINGAQRNYFGGDVLINTTTDNGAKLRVNGSVSFGVHSSATSLTIDDTAMIWIFTGSTNAAFTLPLVSTSLGKTFFVKNQGTASLTLTPSGSDTLYENGSVSTVILLPGDAAIIAADSTYWNVW